MFADLLRTIVVSQTLMTEMDVEKFKLLKVTVSWLVYFLLSFPRPDWVFLALMSFSAPYMIDGLGAGVYESLVTTGAWQDECMKEYNAGHDKGDDGCRQHRGGHGKTGTEQLY